MNIGVYEVYRENGICTLREEKTYKTTVERYTVMKSSELYDLCANILKMDKLTFERMLIVCVDNRYIPRAIFEMGNASHDYCSVSQSALLTKILLTGHSRFFMAHNHPSGMTDPSEADIDITLSMQKAADIVGLHLLDHIIIGDSYYSFRKKRNIKIKRNQYDKPPMGFSKA